jgi:glutamate decarboxylase
MVVQRVVVRNGFTRDLAGMPVRDIRRHLDWFAAQPDFRSTAQAAGYQH